MKRKYLFPGEIVKGANLAIVETLTTGTRYVDCVYKVRYLCCGAKDKLNQAQIRSREQKGRRLCSSCNSVTENHRMAQQKKDPFALSFLYGPLWKVPPVALQLMREERWPR